MEWRDAIPLHHMVSQETALGATWGGGVCPGGQDCKPRLTCAAAGDSNPRSQAPHPGEQTQQSCRDWLAKILPSSTCCKAWNAAWPTQSRNEVSDSAGSGTVTGFPYANAYGKKLCWHSCRAQRARKFCSATHYTQVLISWVHTTGEGWAHSRVFSKNHRKVFSKTDK